MSGFCQGRAGRRAPQAHGWALFVCGWLTLAYATLLFAFLDAKATREEQWLARRFPDYPAYQGRVCKLVPFLH